MSDNEEESAMEVLSTGAWGKPDHSGGLINKSIGARKVIIGICTWLGREDWTLGISFCLFYYVYRNEKDGRSAAAFLDYKSNMDFCTYVLRAT